MALRFAFTVTVEIERESGKFASREEIAEVLIEWLESADQGTVDGIGADGESSYSTTSWEVDES